MVVTPANEISVQALYRIQSARQRLGIRLPERATFDTEPLRLNGRPVTLQHGDKGEYFVPVLPANADKPFLLELRYTVRGDGSSLELPVFSEEAAVQKVYLCVYLPATRALWGSGGPWNEEFQWRLSPGLNWEPRYDASRRPATTRRCWPGWCRGPTRRTVPPRSFLPDGRLYVFSALRPARRRRAAAAHGERSRPQRDDFPGGRAGRRCLAAARLGVRAIFVGGGIIALVLAGVFWPMFSMQILNGVLAAAIFVVLVMWSVAYLAWTRPAGLGPAAGGRPRPAAPPLPKALAAALEAGLPKPHPRSRRPRVSAPGDARASPQARERRRAEPCVATFLVRPRESFCRESPRLQRGGTSLGPAIQPIRTRRVRLAAHGVCRLLCNSHLSAGPCRRLPAVSPRPPSCCRPLPLLGTARPAAAEETAPPEKVRELFVPFKDLNILLENQPRRVLLSREQYDELVEKAKITPARHVPRAAVLTAADYRGASDGQRVRFTGTLAIDVLEKGLQALPLDLSGVGLLSAKLDRRDASIGRTPAGGLSLLLEGVGRHALVLEMVAPLETTAAQQKLFFRLPRAAAGGLRLTVPGDVEIRSGADVAGRVVDRTAGVTRFELLPTSGDATLLMSLNSHLQRHDQAVVARSVLVDEVTAACEKLYATVSLGILYGAVDRFSFVVPEGFEITEITSPLLARWDVQTDGRRKIANVRLRERTTETVVLDVSAVRAPAPLSAWQFPRWEPLGVDGHVAVLGLLAQAPLKAESLQPDGLIPIDTTALAVAAPAGAAEPAADGPPLRPMAAYYAPQGRFGLSGRFVKPPADLAVITNVLLVVEEGGLHAHGGWAMLGEVEKRFSFDFNLPAGWQIVKIFQSNGQPLAFDRCAAGRRAAAQSASTCRRECRPGKRRGPISTPCGRRRAGSPIGNRRRWNFPPFPSPTPRTRKARWWWPPTTI